MSNDIIINIVLSLLIIVGGLGFFVWADLKAHKLKFKNYKLHTKIVLTTTLFLIIVPAIAFFILEYNSASMAGKPIAEKIQLSVFQSVTPRTAGFATINQSTLSQPSIMLTILLMFVGGSSGSTAGGIKTTTVAILFLSIFAEFKRKKSLECFKRRIEDTLLRKACCILMIYLILAIAATIIIAAIDGISILAVLYETVSALCTVGLSLGITSTLSGISHIILIVLMFIGRVGGITLLLALKNEYNIPQSQLPSEKITIG